MCFSCMLARFKRIPIDPNCTNTMRKHTTTLPAWFGNATLNPTVQKLKLGHQRWSYNSSKLCLTDTNINSRSDSEEIITVHHHIAFWLFSFSSRLLWHLWKDLSKEVPLTSSLNHHLFVSCAHTPEWHINTRAWINQKINTHLRAHHNPQTWSATVSTNADSTHAIGLFKHLLLLNDHFMTSAIFYLSMQSLQPYDLLLYNTFYHHISNFLSVQFPLLWICDEVQRSSSSYQILVHSLQNRSTVV